MLGKGPVGVLGAAATLALAACGGSNTVPKAQYIQKADAICATTNAQITSIAQPQINPNSPSVSALPQAASYLNQVVPILRSQSTQIRSLGTPDQNANLVQGALAGLDQGATGLSNAAGAAQAGNAEAFRTNFTGGAQTLQQASAQAREFGFQQCGQVP